MMKWNELNWKGKSIIITALAALVSLIAGLLIGDLLLIFRLVFGSVYVLFVPGFILSFIFFPEGEKKIDWLERIALSFALSIAVVPLVIFYLNLIGLKISPLNSFLSILGIILVEIAIIYVRSKRLYR